MRHIIYGAGGVGGSIGARLFRSGAEVVLIARGAHYDAIRQNGLRYQNPEVDERLQIPVVASPADLSFEAQDLVYLAMKSQHTEAALGALRAAASDGVRVICTQNGVHNEAMALRRFSNVYGQVVVLPAMHLEPGAVQHFATEPGGILDAGCYPQGSDDFIASACDELERAGFSARPDASIMRSKYAKLLQNVGNIVQATVAPDDASREITRQLRREARACFEAAGIDCAGPQEVSDRNTERGPRMGRVPGVERTAGSTWQSVQRQTGNLETDYLNGEIALLGRLHGIPTPANEVMISIAQVYLNEQLPPASLHSELVQHMIEARALSEPGATRRPN